MTLDVYADLDDVTVNLDAAIRAAAPTRPARTRPSEFAGDGGMGGCVATAGRMLRAGCSATICQLTSE